MEASVILCIRPYLALVTQLLDFILSLLAAGIGDLLVISADNLSGVQHCLILLSLIDLPDHILALVLTRPHLLTISIDLPQGVAQLLGQSLGHLPGLGMADLLCLCLTLLGSIDLLHMVHIGQSYRAFY